MLNAKPKLHMRLKDGISDSSVGNFNFFRGFSLLTAMPVQAKLHQISVVMKIVFTCFSLILLLYSASTRIVMPAGQLLPDAGVAGSNEELNKLAAELASGHSYDASARPIAVLNRESFAE